MTDNRLQRIRELLVEEANKKTNKPSTSTGDSASYKFWTADEGTTVTIRFLPDADDNNPWFWVEKQTIRLPFAGTINGDNPTDRDIEIQVPCMDMYADKSCFIINETRPWWKNDAKKDLARTYYKRRTYITQGFVVASPIEEDVVPENPIRRFTIAAELIGKLKSGLADPDMEFHPTDYTQGCDFRIRKTTKGSYANYTTSDFARRTRPLTQIELDAIKTHGLFNLDSYRGAKPSADHVAAIKAMFHASLAGEPYDFAQWGSYYRPYGSYGAMTVATEVAETVSEDTMLPELTEADTTVAKPDSSEILAALRKKTAGSRVAA